MGTRIEDRNGCEISLGSRIKVSECEIGECIGIAFYQHTTTRVFVDYVCGDGRRIESWWNPGSIEVVE